MLGLIPEEKIPKDPLYIGRHGRTKDNEAAARRIQAVLPPILRCAELEMSFVTGPESFLISRPLSDSRKWNAQDRRLFGALVGGSGIVIRIQPENGSLAGGVCMVWPRPRGDRDRQYYPRINIPTDLATMEAVKSVCRHLNLYYLCLYGDGSQRISEFQLGLYHEIPIKHWYGWNKQVGVSSIMEGKSRRRFNAVQFRGGAACRKFCGVGNKTIIKDLREVFA